MRSDVLRGRRLARLSRSRLMVYGATVTLAAGLAGYAISGATAETGRPAGAARSAASPGRQPRAASSFNADTGTTTRVQQQEPPARSDVTLITGDRAELATAPDGGQVVTPLPVAGRHAARGSSGFARFSWAGDQYLVPDEAASYLASGVLDPRLFDASYLARAKLASRLPVQVSYAGRAAPSLPGLHITRAAGGTATGTLAGSVGFGRLLASRQAAALASHSGPGVLPGITRVSLAPPPGAPPLPALPTATGGQPAGPAAGISTHAPAYHTLTLKFTAPSGGAGTAIGFVQNVDNSNLLPGSQQPPFVFPGGITTVEARGSYKISVPAGTYSAEFAIITPHRGTYLGYDAALVTKPQFTVASDTTITLSPHAAVPYHVTLGGITTPPVQTSVLNFERTSTTGAGVGGLGAFYTMDLMSVSGGGYTGARLSASPTVPVTKGKLAFQATTFLGARPSGGAEPRPTYLLNFPDANRIPSALSYTVRRSALTAYHERLYTNLTGTCGRADSLYVFTYQPAAGPDAYNQWPYLAPPGGSRTDYWYDADPHLDTWVPAAVDGDCPPGDIGFSTMISLIGAPRQIHPGGSVSESWDEAPLAAPPAATAMLGDPFAYNVVSHPRTTVCSACRQGDVSFVSLLPYGDSDPAHYDSLDVDPRYFSTTYFYRGGKLAIPSCFDDACSTTPYDLYLPLLPRAASYRLDWSYASPNDPASTTAVDWTFRSAPDPGAGKLPGHELCPPIPSQGCSYLPLLFIGYHLALNYHSRAQAGHSFPVTFTVTHQQGETPPTRVSATVSASFDNGKTWTTPQAASSQDGGRFTATITQPPLSQTSGFVSLRVTAHDGAGDSVTETLIQAYGLTG